MKQERVVLSFIMVFIGLVVAAGAFFFYQSTKDTGTQVKEAAVNITPTPQSGPTIFLKVNEPKDESLSDRKTVKVSGKTNTEATIVILTVGGQEVVKPSLQGDFTTTITIDDGPNYIKIQAILPNGEILTEERVVSYTTEDF
ncbi:MAG: hypothetical protein HY344_01325 [Candidatus Levybacteria bacterium]|nr:hypothetical protein [Candidatus Levybacteria bacterium]